MEYIISVAFISQFMVAWQKPEYMISISYKNIYANLKLHSKQHKAKPVVWLRNGPDRG